MLKMCLLLLLLLRTPSSTPTTFAVTDVFARRSCLRCGRRMSSLQFDKHTLCVVCRDDTVLDARSAKLGPKNSC